MAKSIVAAMRALADRRLPKSDRGAAATGKVALGDDEHACQRQAFLAVASSMTMTLASRRRRAGLRIGAWATIAPDGCGRGRGRRRRRSRASAALNLGSNDRCRSRSPIGAASARARPVRSPSRLASGLTTSSACSARLPVVDGEFVGTCAVDGESRRRRCGRPTRRPSSETSRSGVRRAAAISRPASATGSAASAQPGRGRSSRSAARRSARRPRRRDQPDGVERRALGEPARDGDHRRQPLAHDSKNGPSSPNGMASAPSTANGMTTAETIGIAVRLASRPSGGHPLEMLGADRWRSRRRRSARSRRGRRAASSMYRTAGRAASGRLAAGRAGRRASPTSAA